MSELRVQMDPLNPGQFFSCCGLFDLMTVEDYGVLAHLQVDPGRPRVAEFVLQGELPPLAKVLGQLRLADVEFLEEGEAATRPARLAYGPTSIELDWWLDEFREKSGNLKCWAGQVTTANLFSELLPLLDEQSEGHDVFGRASMTKAKFGVDPRSAWNALDFGFSPNEHGKDSATFPAVEVLAAVGLQGFRPDARRRQNVDYCLWREPLPASVARLAFRVPWPGLPVTAFSFGIAKRGQSYKYFAFGNRRKETQER